MEMVEQMETISVGVQEEMDESHVAERTRKYRAIVIDVVVFCSFRIEPENRQDGEEWHCKINAPNECRAGDADTQSEWYYDDSTVPYDPGCEGVIADAGRTSPPTDN